MRIYSELQIRQMKKRAALYKTAAVLIAVCAWITCVTLCIITRTATDAILHTAVVLVSLCAGWAVILLLTMGYQPNKAGASHAEGILKDIAREETVSGLLLQTDSPVRIPGSVEICRVSILCGEEKKRLSILESKRETLPSPGSTVTVKVVRSFISEVEDAR